LQQVASRASRIGQQVRMLATRANQSPLTERRLLHDRACKDPEHPPFSALLHPSAAWPFPRAALQRGFHCPVNNGPFERDVAPGLRRDVGLIPSFRRSCCAGIGIGLPRTTGRSKKGAICCCDITRFSRVNQSTSRGAVGGLSSSCSTRRATGLGAMLVSFPTT
jgi:hypothetical protein